MKKVITVLFFITLATLTYAEDKTTSTSLNNDSGELQANNGEKYLTTLCGLTFGARYPYAKIAKKTTDGHLICDFKPKKRFMNFSSYLSMLSPQTKTLHNLQMFAYFKTKQDLEANMNNVITVLSSYYKIDPKKHFLPDVGEVVYFQFSNGLIMLSTTQFDVGVYSLGLNASVTEYSKLAEQEAKASIIRKTDTSALK